MSEAPKPVDTPVETPAAPVVEETPKPADAPAESPVVEAPKDDTSAEPVTEEAAKEAPKEEPKEEVKPATDGVLGYKAPGLVKSFRFSKRYFWFSDEAVEVKQLGQYFQHEKLSAAHPTAAWASQTGKGLLFFTKRAEDKAHPTGIINLAEVTDVTKDGATDFLFKWNGHKHVFQAANANERDGWVLTVEAQAVAGKAEKDALVESDGYKAELEKLTKPPVVAAAPVKKTPEDKGKEAAKDEPEAEPVATPAQEADAKTDAKSRSRSRKRQSLFGGVFGKKEEAEKKEDKKEEKKEEKTEAKEETKAEETPAPVEVAPVAETATEAPVVAPVVAPATEEAKPEEKKTEEKKTETPVKAKRASIFGSLFQKKEQEKKEEPKTAETTVSSTAPQLDNPVEGSAAEPIKPEAVTQPKATPEAAKEGEQVATSPSSKAGFFGFMKKEEKKEDKKEEKVEDKKPEEAAPATEAAASPAAENTTPGALKEKRRTSFFGNLGTKKEKKPETEGEQSEGEAAKVKSPASKIGSIFRRPSKAVKKETAPAAAPETEPIAETGETTEADKKVDAPVEESAAPAVNGTEEEANKPADAPAATPAAATPAAAAPAAVAPVQAAA